MKHPDQEALLEETYDEMESDLQRRIEGLTHQIDLLSDRRSTILRVNRVAKTAMDVFGDILAKEKLDRNDLRLIIDHIRVYEDHLEIQLQADIDQLLRSCELEDTVNFKPGIENALGCQLVQSARNQRDKVFDVHVVSSGEAYMDGTDNGDGTYTCTVSVQGEQNGYTAATAPIVMPVETPGYAAMTAPSG